MRMYGFENIVNENKNVDGCHIGLIPEFITNENIIFHQVPSVMEKINENSV